jgi:transcriptional regulator with AAA-type ATPase domain
VPGSERSVDELPADVADTPATGDDAPAARPRPLRIEVVSGPDRGASLELISGTYFVGKDAGCDLVLADAAVSRRHLEVAVLARGVRLRDLGSTNGSHYQGARFEAVVLEPGAHVRVGRSELRVVPSEAGAATSTTPILRLPSPVLPVRFGALESNLPAMQQVFSLLARAAGTDAPVLVEGETGTGKELAAEGIHAASPRRRAPFVICDLASLPRSLIESELFGHVRGAFTGADRDRRGAFVEAHGGTLFLDEIGELELEAQPRLLRAIERKQVKPVGASGWVQASCRIVAATNRDLGAEVRAGRFREDLYHRLAVVRVRLLPLRQRRDDIPRLALSILARAAAARGRPAPRVAPETMAVLKAYDWPGNVRELRNVLERAVSLASAGETLDERLLGLDDPRLRADVSSLPVEVASPFKEAKDRLVAAWEKDYVAALLRRHGGNVSMAARAGGMDRVYLHRLMKKHGLS